MTVTLAFKAFAKAIPCLTPFLARSDPSVLKRILAYIRGLPCSSNIFPKKVILTYMVRSSPSVYAWTNERPGMAVLGPREMSDLSPQSALKRTLSRHRRMTGHDPQRTFSRLLALEPGRSPRCHNPRRRI